MILAPPCTGLFLLSVYQKATTKIVVANFILPLILHTLGYGFLFIYSLISNKASRRGRWNGYPGDA